MLKLNDQNHRRSASFSAVSNAAKHLQLQGTVGIAAAAEDRCKYFFLLFSIEAAFLFVRIRKCTCIEH